MYNIELAKGNAIASLVQVVLGVVINHNADDGSKVDNLFTRHIEKIDSTHSDKEK